MLSYLLAVLAAGSNAVSSVLQRKADSEEPPELAMRPALILDLLHRPVWLAGMLAVIASFLLDAAALSMGQLAAIQPIVVLELPLTLILAARVFRSRVGSREWLAIAVMTAGLAGLIFCLDPSQDSRHRITALDWVIGTVVTLAAAAMCVVLSSRGGPTRRPALLGLAGGITFGLTAAYTKGATAGLHHGPAGIFLRWETYAMAVAGVAALFLVQNALQAGRLIAAQPGITLADPGVAIIWGVLAFHEQTREGAWAAGAVLAAAALVAGTVVLVRSPLLDEGAESRDAEETPLAASTEM